MAIRSALLLGVCVALFALGQFHRAAGAVAAPLWTRDFSLSPEQLGTVIGVIFIATILAQAPIGAALDRFGPRPVLTLTIAVVALGTYACLWAPNYTGLLVARSLIGVGLASTGIGMYLILARHFPADQFGFLNGLMVTLGGIGGLAATYPLAATVEAFGWRASFAWLAFGTLALAILILVAVGRTQKEADKVTAMISTRALLATRGILPILLLSSVTYAPIVTITGLWGGPYFTGVHGLSLSTAGAILFLLFGATMAAGTVFGLIDRYGVSRRRTIAVAALGSAALFALAGALTPIGPWAVVAVLTAAIFLQNFYVPLLADLKDSVPDAAIGRATSLFSIISVGAIPVMQTGYGAILARFDSFQTGHIAALLGMAAVIFSVTLAYLAMSRDAL